MLSIPGGTLISLVLIGVIVAMLVQVVKLFAIKPLLADTDPRQNVLTQLVALLVSWATVCFFATSALTFNSVRVLIVPAFVVWISIDKVYHLFNATWPNVASLLTPGQIDATPPAPSQRTPLLSRLLRRAPQTPTSPHVDPSPPRVTLNGTGPVTATVTQAPGDYVNPATGESYRITADGQRVPLPTGGRPA